VKDIEIPDYCQSCAVLFVLFVGELAVFKVEVRTQIVEDCRKVSDLKHIVFVDVWGEDEDVLRSGVSMDVKEHLKLFLADWVHLVEVLLHKLLNELHFLQPIISV
jgi:hypothetical protein